MRGLINELYFSVVAETSPNTRKLYPPTFVLIRELTLKSITF